MFGVPRRSILMRKGPVSRAREREREREGEREISIFMDRGSTVWKVQRPKGRG